MWLEGIRSATAEYVEEANSFLNVRHATTSESGQRYVQYYERQWKVYQALTRICRLQGPVVEARLGYIESFIFILHVLTLLST
jgi:hypothetical protein